MASHHFTARDPWPMTTGTYDYLDFLGLDDLGRARVQTTSGDVEALGFIGGIGAATANTDILRLGPGSGPQPAHERLCMEVMSVVPDGQGGYAMSYRLARRGATAGCQPCLEP